MRKHILAPIVINKLHIPNRTLVPAMVTRLSGEDGYVNQAIIDRYVSYAKGNVGLIIVEAMAIHQSKSGPLLRISNDDFIAGHKKLTTAIHEVSESKVIPQIIHFMKVARSGWRQTIDMLSEEDIRAIIRDFGDAALRAKQAGYDGIELHSAHAYTLSSFLSRHNKRRDRYNGRTLEGRLRMFGDVMAEVRSKVGPDFVVGVRFLADEMIKDGYTLEDSRLIALRMAQLGVDYISLSVGKINAPDDAEQLLRDGKADMIGMARQLLADPNWPKKVALGAEDDIVRCVYCNVCKQLDETFKEVTCFLWPKNHLQAPEYDPMASAPTWDYEAPLTGIYVDGVVKLKWQKTTADVSGYDIYRTEDEGDIKVIEAQKSGKFDDKSVLGGLKYSYYIRAFTKSGQASAPSNVVVLDLPMEQFSPQLSVS